MVSIETSLVFFGLFALIFLMGTVFPQSSEPDRLEKYGDAGGRLVGLAGSLNLLNVFHSWYFGLLVLLFTLHVLLCSIHRFDILRKRPKFRLFTRESLLRREISFSVTSSLPDAAANIEKKLRSMGFRRLKYYSEDAHLKRLIVEKGLPFRWLSWAYHLCILTALAGFALSYCFAFEDYLVLAVGERKAIRVRSPETNYQILKKLLRGSTDAPSRQIEIELARFRTEYTQRPVLQYPHHSFRRLLAVWGGGDETLHYQLTDDSLFVRDWFSLLNIYEEGRLIRKKEIEVNDPLRYAGLTFYQIGYDYECSLTVADELIPNVPAGEPFTIPQMEGEFRLNTPRLGTLFRYDGKIAVLSPTAELQYRPPALPRKRKWTTVADLPLAQTREAMHTRMTLNSIRQSSVLSYRYDPGVPLLWFAATAALIFMALRIYMPWYQVHCHADSSTGRIIIAVSIRLVGLFARPERLREKLKDALRG